MNGEYVYLRNTLTSTRTRSLSPVDTDAVIETADLSKKDVADLQRDPAILAATPNMPTELIAPVALEDSTSQEEFAMSLANEEDTKAKALQDNDAFTWGIQAVRANESKYSGKGAIVAILDTGIDATHKRFADVKVVTKNFTKEKDEDIDGHGTHCAGTVFGQNIEGQPRIGVAPDIKKALIGKVLGKSGGSTAWVANGIQWATSEGAHIISMSLGSSILGHFNMLQDRGMSLQNALSTAFNNYQSNVKFYNSIVKYNQGRSQDAVIIAASGNESGRFGARVFNAYDAPCGTPAVAEGILSVGALGLLGNMFAKAPDDKKSLMTVASFSNYNNDISAPGHKILSTHLNNKYKKLNGTSMATPHVAGVAALWVQKQLDTFGHVKPDMLRYQLQGNASMDSIISNIKQFKIDPSDIGVGIVQAPL